MFFDEKGRKDFFSEEKKQKTFISSACCGSWVAMDRK
jgi:hypothetical protein